MAQRQDAPTIFTIGHSTRPVGEFIALLREAGVDCLVDVRSAPRSRTNPQFNADTLPATLAAAGIGHCHLAALGGLRGRSRRLGPSPNTLWRNASFRNYADYAMGAEFRAGLAALRGLAAERRCAIMCAEAVWWRCHRGLIADVFKLHGTRVLHIMDGGNLAEHPYTPAAHVADGRLDYSSPQRGF